jgi:hypothetical protein
MITDLAWAIVDASGNLLCGMGGRMFAFQSRREARDFLANNAEAGDHIERVEIRPIQDKRGGRRG